MDMTKHMLIWFLDPCWWVEERNEIVIKKGRRLFKKMIEVVEFLHDLPHHIYNFACCVRACVCRGAETQCPFLEVLKPKSWKPNIEVLKPRSWEPNIEVLKPKFWKPNAATLAFIALRYVKTRRQQQKKKVAKNSRQ